MKSLWTPTLAWLAAAVAAFLLALANPDGMGLSASDDLFGSQGATLPR